MIPCRPSNFDQFSEHLQNITSAIDWLKPNEKVLFYDTCSFSRHANLSDKSAIIEHLKNFNAVILLEVVCYELSHNLDFQAQYIDHAKELKNAGIQLLLLDESQIARSLHNSFGLLYQNKFQNGLNDQLGFIVSDIKKFKKGILRRYLELETLFSESYLHTTVRAKPIYCEKIIKHIWNQKKSGIDGKPGDSLAEELMMLISQWIPHFINCEFYILSDDKRMLALLRDYQSLPKRARDNQPQLITSLRLVDDYIKGKSASVSEADLIILIRTICNPNDKDEVNCVVLDEFGEGCKMITFKSPDLAKNMLNNHKLKVVY